MLIAPSGWPTCAALSVGVPHHVSLMSRSVYIYIYIRSTLYSRSLFASYTIFPDYLTRSVSNQFHPTISEYYARADYTASSPLTGIMVRKTRFHSLQLNYRRDACFDRSNFRRYFFSASIHDMPFESVLAVILIFHRSTYFRE